MKKTLVALTALLASASAQASIIPSLVGDPTPVGNGVFSYRWEATLASDQALNAGSYFTLYDLRGFAGFGTLPANWTGSTQNLGLTPPNVTPDDDPALLNVSFIYNGPTLNYSDDPNNNTELTLGVFEVFSTVGTFGFEDFTSRAIRNAGVTRGSPVSTIGDDAVAVPGGDGGGNPSPVPEPATWTMLIAGFGLVGITLRRRKAVPTA